MRWTKVIFISILLIFTLACQCAGPAYLLDWIQNHTELTPTLAATQVSSQDGIETEINSTPLTITTIPEQTDTAIVLSTATPIITQIPTIILSPTQEEGGKSRSFDITETIELTNDGPGITKRIVIWVALIQTISPYQKVISSSISTEDYATIADQYGNKFAKIEIDNLLAGESRSLEFSYRVTVNEIKYQLNTCTGSSIEEFLEDEKNLESNSPLIISLGESLQQGSSNDCETARSIYDYIGDNFTYSEYTAEDIGALQALNNGYGDCTEFSDLFVALNRAVGIPANFVEGVTCCTTNGFSAGSVQHDWAEIYLPGNGWVPVDITWGRFQNKREMYFAQLPPDHIIITRGRNLETLGGFHFYYYQYYWEGLESKVNAADTWSILESNR